MEVINGTKCAKAISIINAPNGCPKHVILPLPNGKSLKMLSFTSMIVVALGCCFNEEITLMKIILIERSRVLL